jgi:hypothetical protein
MPATALDTDLVTNVKKALKRESAVPMFFAFVMKGGTDGKLIVSKARIPPKQIDGAKKETGGSAVLKGVCYGENGTLVFEMAKPAAPNVAAVTKNVLKAKAGLAIKVEYRVGRDEETIPESAEPDLPSDDAGKAVPGADGAAATAPGAADLDAEWKAKLAERTPAIKAALAARGPNAGDIGKLLAQATALSKPGGDMAQALAKLAECHYLTTAGAAPAVPPKAAGGDPAAAEWKAKLAELTPAIKTALAARGPNAGDIGKLLAQATALSKPGGDMAQALAKLTECHALATTGTPPSPSANGRAALVKRLNGLAGAIKAALTGTNAARVQTLSGAVSRLLKNNDIAQASRMLDELEPLLGGARASSGAGAGPQVGKQVAFAHAKIRWNQAKDGVRQQLETLHKEILEEFNDPESADATKRLKKVLERFNEGLGDALDDLYVAEEPRRAALRTRVGDIAAKYLAYVRDDPLVLHVEDNPFMDVTVQATLERPLLDLQAQLTAR